jgi:phosphoribosylamine-glycine ligase
LPEHDTSDDETIIFHAGTKQVNDEVVTSGGRVLCVTTLAETLNEAADKAKQVLDEIHFTDKYYRKDIGYEFISLSPKEVHR